MMSALNYVLSKIYLLIFQSTGKFQLCFVTDFLYEKSTYNFKSFQIINTCFVAKHVVTFCNCDF